MTSTEPLDASVVIACFTEERWPQLSAAIESALNQKRRAGEVIVVVDHNESLAQRLTEQWPEVTVLANLYGRGASGARNTGAFRARSSIVAFLDDDATADPDWLETLVKQFDDPSVVGVGGGVTAAWVTPQPRWFPEEFFWVVGVSYKGLPEQVAEVRNVWAENMAVRAERFSEVGGFRLNFGKVGSRSSPEDTDLCIRMAGADGRWLLVPQALVAHHVPPDRATFRFFVRRCYVEGIGKAALVGLTSRSAMDSERDYTRYVLPRAVSGGLLEAVSSRRIAPALRAAAVAVGLLSAATGYGRGRLSRLWK
jgi:cellulose synthase/poly-beta-1,6-N-acetylglucosamine synthase-like glycosyltransferase